MATKESTTSIVKALDKQFICINGCCPRAKILAGTNYVDVGFELDPDSGRVICMAAIDNLMKGAAGSAVQSMNLVCGFDETLGLEFGGLHPI